MNIDRNQFLQGRVTVIIGDITLQDVDAIVNAANSSLLGGGGVDGAIHLAGGPRILEECREIRTQYPEGLPTGEAVITSGGNLPARHVIHTVGPIYGKHGGREAELLAACYKNSLTLALKHSVTSIAFPAISTGVYGYRRSEAAAIASEAIKQFLTEHAELKDVRMVFLHQGDAALFLANHRFQSRARKDDIKASKT